MVTKTTRTAEQQAAIDAARAAKAQRKQTVSDVPFVETEEAGPQAAKVEEAAFTEYVNGLMANLPSWKRALTALVVSGLVGWGLGTLAGNAIAYLTVGAIMFGASAFLANVIFWLGVIVAVYATYRASAFCYLKIVDKTVDDKFFAAKEWVTGLFSSKVKVPA